jgi:hypothetical protein
MPFDSPLFPDRDAILRNFPRVRANSQALAAPLTPEDWRVQSMPDASPVKWNLAHTSWFFETFILEPHAPGYDVFHIKFGYLFNSYYMQIGTMHPRPELGVLSRPSADDILKYRAYVDNAIRQFIETAHFDGRRHDDIDNAIR